MMNKEIICGQRSGRIRIPSSKSAAHRMLICAAFGASPCVAEVEGFSKDILATLACLEALGAGVEREEHTVRITPVRRPFCAGADGSASDKDSGILLHPGESGSTLRFLLPVTGITGKRAVFLTEGRLGSRPLAPLDRVLHEHGRKITREGERVICEGRLTPGKYSLPGNVSSQYFSALLMTLPLLEGESTLSVEGELESAPYVALTEEALRRAGIRIEKPDERSWRIPGGQIPRLPERIRLEGDWSNAAFFLCMGALSEEGIVAEGLDFASRQGDREILTLLQAFGADIRRVAIEDGAGEAVAVKQKNRLPLRVDASQIPDLVPTLAALACAAEGESVIENASRLRLKESDRIRSTAGMIRALGGEVEELPDGMRIFGHGSLRGGTVQAENDHRIAMSAAVAASICESNVTVEGAECVEKSYPAFWRDLESLCLRGGENTQQSRNGKKERDA